MNKTLPILALILATNACSFQQEPAPYLQKGDEKFSRSNSVHYTSTDYIDNPQIGTDFSSADIESAPLDSDFVEYSRNDEVIDFGGQQQNSNNYSGYTVEKPKPATSDYIDAPSSYNSAYALDSEPTKTAVKAKPVIEDPILTKPAYNQIETAARTPAPTTTGQGYLDLSGVKNFNSTSATSSPASNKLSGIAPRSKPVLSEEEEVEVAAYKEKPISAPRHETKTDMIAVPKLEEVEVAVAPSTEKIEPIGESGDDIIERSPIIEKAKPETLQRLFMRPIDGEVIAKFGNEADGTFNDGIKIRAAKGTDVHAADAGEVVYSGNQLQGYGNMVIVRHASGYLTSYAHLDNLTMKKGEKISKGQTIGKVGDTGNVSEPQLHFGVREGREPVDPQKFL